MAMCDGDFQTALELAVGAPPPRDAAEAARRNAFLQELDDSEPTPAEMEAFRREEEAREERLDESSITTGTEKLMTLAHAWFDKHPDARTASSDPAFAEALEVASWDVHLIGAKLYRALHGHDEFANGNAFEDEPIQNDWNGSAKVALISIHRSIRAWAAIARAANDPEAADIAMELRRLQIDVERTFPDAWKFIRPGFDQNGQARADNSAG